MGGVFQARIKPAAALNNLSAFRAIRWGMGETGDKSHCLCQGIWLGGARDIIYARGLGDGGKLITYTRVRGGGGKSITYAEVRRRGAKAHCRRLGYRPCPSQSICIVM